MIKRQTTAKASNVNEIYSDSESNRHAEADKTKGTISMILFMA